MVSVDYSAIRGFNYQPSYGSHGLETWGAAFDLEVFRREIGRGRKYFPGMNVIRLWLSHDAYLRHPQSMPDRFHQVVDLADELGVRFIPTLFNGWHSLPDFGGIAAGTVAYWGKDPHFEEGYLPFIRSIVQPHMTDRRILLWDLCNEPFNECPCESARDTVLQWLQHVHRACKSLGVQAPLSVGSVPNMDAIRLVAPLSDVITFHPYYAWNAWMKDPQGLETFLDQAMAFCHAAGKPFLATETGWDALDDRKRAEVLAVELSALKRRNIGFVAHLLHHTLVADGHRPEYGPITDAGYMAFIEADGSLRACHEIFNKF